MQTVAVSDKGQVVIPVEIRRRLGVAPRCQLDFRPGGACHPRRGQRGRFCANQKV